MKRIIAILLSCLLVLPISGCGNRQEPLAKKTAWDLNEIYSDESAFEADYESMTAKISEINSMFGNLNTVDAFVSLYQAMDEVIALHNRLESYSIVRFYKNMSDPANLERMTLIEEIDINQFMNDSLLEMKSAENTLLDAVAADKRMKPYLYWFNCDRNERMNHALTADKQKLLEALDKDKNEAKAFYDTIIYEELVFPEITFPDGEKMPANEIAYSKSWAEDFDQDFRIKVYDSMIDTYATRRDDIAKSYENHCLAEKEAATIYGYSSVLESQLSIGGISPDVYSTSVEASKKAKQTADQYLSLIQKTTKYDKVYNFNANKVIADNPGIVIPYEEATEIISKALAPLGKEYNKQVDKTWNSSSVDIYPAEDKYLGSFVQPVFGVKPYIMMNYEDKCEDVDILATQIGYAAHYAFSDTQKSAFSSNPETISLQTSTFIAKLLTSDFMIENSKTDAERRCYIAQQMNWLFSNFHIKMIIARFQAETMIEVEQGRGLTADKLDEMWESITLETLGEKYCTTDSYASSWIRKNEIYYDYSDYELVMGLAAACSIVEKIQAGNKDVVSSYMDFIKAGDSANVEDLFESVGVDFTNVEYVDAFTARFDRLIEAF